MAGLFEEFDPYSRMATNQYGIGGDDRTIRKGTLVSFYYPQSMAWPPNVIHDKYPMIILTDIWPNYIRGVNLHYLTFPYVKALLTNFADNGTFDYLNIKPDRYITRAFRMYIRQGVKRPRKLDAEFLKTVLQSVRSFNPGEIEKIRANIQKQIQQRLQAKAKELTSYDEWRKSLHKGQKWMVNQRIKGITDTLTRGQQESLQQLIPKGSKPQFDLNTTPQTGQPGGPDEVDDFINSMNG